MRDPQYTTLEIVRRNSLSQMPWIVDRSDVAATLAKSGYAEPTLWLGERIADNDHRTVEGSLRGVCVIAASCEQLRTLADEVEWLVEPDSSTTVVCVDLEIPGWKLDPQPLTTPAGHNLWIAHPGSGGTFDEGHLVIAAGPNYDGFATCTFTAHRNVGIPRFHASDSVEAFVTVQHPGQPVFRGQTIGLDLELSPASLPRTGVRGTITALDECGCVLSSLIITLVGHPGIECSVSGSESGPLPDPLLTEAADRLLSGERRPWRLIAALDRAEQRELASRLGGARGVLARAYGPMLSMSDWMWRP